MDWLLEERSKISSQDSIVVEGLPGIGSVGKIAVDFLIEKLNAKLAAELFSYSLPHTVFVKEDDSVELPSIRIYHKRIKKKDIFFLAGDIQPMTEESCYLFCDMIMNFCKKKKCRMIITTGGIGLNEIFERPKVYAAGTSKKVLASFKKGVKVEKSLYGVVGPIMGVTGVLIGMAKKRGMNGVSLLAETYGHPMYVGIKGARAILDILNEKLSLGITLEDLDNEISKLEKETLKKSKELSKMIRREREETTRESNYIG